MKNLAMSLPAAGYYGYPRKKIHQSKSPKGLQDFIVAMCARFPIHLGIIAAHPAMTGTGPIRGQTSYPGLILASRDFVAADRVGALILGYKQVRHVQKAAELGLGKADLNEVEVKGLSIYKARGWLYSA